MAERSGAKRILGASSRGGPDAFYRSKKWTSGPKNGPHEIGIPTTHNLREALILFSPHPSIYIPNAHADIFKCLIKITNSLLIKFLLYLIVEAYQLRDL